MWKLFSSGAIVASSLRLAPQAAAGVAGLALQGAELFEIGEGETGVGEAVALADDFGVQESSVFEINVGERAAVAVLRLRRVEDEADTAAFALAAGELSRFLPEVLNRAVGRDAFRRIDANQPDAVAFARSRVGVRRDDERVAVHHTHRRVPALGGRGAKDIFEEPRPPQQNEQREQKCHRPERQPSPPSYADPHSYSSSSGGWAATLLRSACFGGRDAWFRTPRGEQLGRLVFILRLGGEQEQVVELVEEAPQVERLHQAGQPALIQEGLQAGRGRLGRQEEQPHPFAPLGFAS